MDLGGSHILATVIKTAMNIGMLISAWVLAFNSSGHILRSKVAGPCCNPMLNFGRKHQNIFHSSCIILHSYQQYVRVLHTNVNTFLFVVYNHHLNGYKALSYCGFYLHFPNDVEHTFQCSLPYLLFLNICLVTLDLSWGTKDFQSSLWHATF